MHRGGSFLIPSGGKCFWSAGFLARSGAFSPASLANLLLWFDAQNGASVTGDPVSQWNDAGPGGRHLAQAVSANQPDLQTSQVDFGGRACLELAEGEVELQGWMSRSSEAVTSELSGTVWAVAAFHAIGERVVLSVSHNAPSQRYWQVYAADVAGEMRWGATYRSGSTATEGGVYSAGAEGVLSAGQAYLLTASSDGDHYRLWINGRQFGGGGPGSITGSFTLGDTGSWIGDVVSRDRLTLGARIASGQPVAAPTPKLRVAEIVVTSPESSAVEIQRMHEYLSARYGIALSP